MKTKKFDVYSDPGHGWAKVKLTEIVKLGIQEQISGYSYVRGDYAYLEEGCDLTTFVLAARKAGYEPKWREHSSDKRSKIRNYESYTSAQALRLCRFYSELHQPAS
jgi:hypothetical protein